MSEYFTGEDLNKIVDLLTKLFEGKKCPNIVFFRCGYCKHEKELLKQLEKMGFEFGLIVCVDQKYSKAETVEDVQIDWEPYSPEYLISVCDYDKKLWENSIFISVNTFLTVDFFPNKEDFEREQKCLQEMPAFLTITTKSIQIQKFPKF